MESIDNCFDINLDLGVIKAIYIIEIDGTRHRMKTYCDIYPDHDYKMTVGTSLSCFQQRGEPATAFLTHMQHLSIRMAQITAQLETYGFSLRPPTPALKSAAQVRRVLREVVLKRTREALQDDAKNEDAI